MERYTDQIQKIIEKEIALGQIAGASIKIIKDNKEIYENQFGFADRENKVTMKEDTIYRMYSMTKPITVAAVMLLFERGELDLTEPVSKYLEGFENQKVIENGKLVDVKQAVTIQNLLNMTSGIVYPDSDETGLLMEKIFDEAIQLTIQGKGLSTIELCNRIGSSPLAFQPGEQFRYGASIDILGAIVEVVSGKKLSQFLQMELFEPLEMVDTEFYVPEEKWHRFAQNYEFDQNAGELKPYLGKNLIILDYRTAPAFESGGAGLVSTIEDYRKFALMLVQDGLYQGKRILGRKTIDFMRTNQLNEKQRQYINWDSLKGYGYGNGLRVLMDPVQAATNASLGEFGWGGWTGNYISIDPVEKMIFMYFIQRVDLDPNLTIRKLRAIAYAMIS